MLKYRAMNDSSPPERNPLLALAQPRDLSLPMKVVARQRPGYTRAQPKLMVCVNERPAGEGASCGPRGGTAIHAALQVLLRQENLDGALAAVRCLGTCDRGPTLRLVPNNSWFYGAHVADVPILASHLKSALEEHAALPPSHNEQEMQ